MRPNVIVLALLLVACGAHKHHGSHHGNHHHHQHHHSGEDGAMDLSAAANHAASFHKQCRLCVQNNVPNTPQESWSWFCPPTTDRPVADTQGKCVPYGACETTKIDAVVECPNDLPETKATCLSCLLDGYIWNAREVTDAFSGECRVSPDYSKLPVTDWRLCPEAQPPLHPDAGNGEDTDQDGDANDAGDVFGLIFTLLIVLFILSCFVRICKRWRMSRRRRRNRGQGQQLQQVVVPAPSAPSSSQPFIDHGAPQSDVAYAAVATAPPSPVPGAAAYSDEPVYDVGPTVAPIHYVARPATPGQP